MDQLLIALDLDTGSKALEVADAVRGTAGAFKIGSRLFTTEGPAIVRTLVERGDRVFLDLKYHDIPSTVAGAVAAATRLGIWMLTVHAGGGVEMLRAARQAAGDTAAALGRPAPLIVAVTVLTSFNSETLRATGVARTLEDQVAGLAADAHRAGVNGVVASPLEIGIIRNQFKRDFLIVTPGIRPAAAGDDQSRTMSAGDAIRAGADYLVVGRPVIAAADPAAAAAGIANEINAAVQGR